MNKIISMNERIEKLPTSQLIFYMTHPEMSYESNKSKVEAITFGRLTKSYKLYPDMAKQFIKREKEVINARGYDIQSYSFGKDRMYNDLLKIFYESVTLISQVVKIEDNFNTLTMSEIVEFFNLFEYYKTKYETRAKMFDLEFRKNYIALKKLSTNNRISFENKEQKINKLLGLLQSIELQNTNESSLIEYNDLLATCMLSKMKAIMGYQTTDDLRAILTMLKESLLVKKSPMREQEKKLHHSINFDAYTHDISLISEYNVQDYPFSKKK